MNDKTSLRYLFRSLLFVPGHNEKLIKKAITTDADVLILDLEDSVQPSDLKQNARDLILNMFNDNLFKGKIVFIRVNDRESGHLLKDIHQLSVAGVRGFMYPKAKCSQDIYFIDKLLETIEHEKGIRVGTFKLIPLIETTSSVLQSDSICKASDRIEAIAFGSEDFITDLQSSIDTDLTNLQVPRAIISMAARANNIIPIDTVHIDVHNLEDLEIQINISKKYGFDGMLVLHPKEIPFVHKHYTPSEEEYLNAKELLKMNEQAKKEGRGVAVINGKFIGPPFVLKSKKIIEKYEFLISKGKIL
jgi:citrate lyase subunit beta/citryl-CoA lyase